MANINTFGQPLALREAMRWFFDERAVPSTGRASTSGLSDVADTLPLNLYSTPDHYTIRALLPGALPDTIEITYAHDTLTIRAAIPQPPVPQGEEMTWYYRELATGAFARTVRFLEPVDPEKIESSFTNGVLTLTLPKAEPAKPKKIAITSGTPELAGSSRERHPILEKIRKSVPVGRHESEEGTGS